MAVRISNYVDVKSVVPSTRSGSGSNTPSDEFVREVVENPIFKQGVADTSSGISAENQSALAEYGESDTIVPALDTLASAVVAAKESIDDTVENVTAIQQYYVTVPGKGNASGAGAGGGGSCTINLKPKAASLESGDVIYNFTIQTASSNPTSYTSVYAAILKQNVAATTWQKFTNSVEYPTSTATDVTFNFRNPVVLDDKDSYYFIRFYEGTPPDTDDVEAPVSPIATFRLNCYNYGTSNPDCYYSNAQFIVPYLKFATADDDIIHSNKLVNILREISLNISGSTVDELKTSLVATLNSVADSL